MRVLLVDNYDSFTYNIAHVLSGLGADVTVLRNDDPALDVSRVDQWPLVVIGPGPGRPTEAGVTLAVIDQAVTTKTPLFGVCLGQQAIGQYFGGEVVHAPALMHGKTSEITHDANGIFAGIEPRFIATRYHSLCIAEASLPTELRITARSDDGVIQGIAHTSLPVYAVQFHPESILTVAGPTVFKNMLDIAAAKV
jgi:anthranilate synthase/aminodeoxychorismate synthase-like glutamine amidotransferase